MIIPGERMIITRKSSINIVNTLEGFSPNILRNNTGMVENKVPEALTAIAKNKHNNNGCLATIHTITNDIKPSKEG